ncbi:MAG: ATP-binding protein [Solirubrobacteraceae bacterium]
MLERIAADAAGIPLFAEEITYMLLESNVLIEREDQLELTVPLERLDIPVTLHDSLMARLDGAGEAKRVAQIAAVVGRDFDSDLVGSISGLDDDVVRERLGQLVAAQLLFKLGESPQATYTFKHALIQEAAYGSLLKRTRRELHAKTAQVLDERGRAGAPDLSQEVIARHYRAAREIPQAIEAYCMAAKQSAGRPGHAEAAEHLKRALAVMSELPDAQAPMQLERPCRFLNDLGDAYWNEGNFEDAQEAFREAADLASRLGLPEQLARAALGFGGRMAFGAGFRDETLIALLQAALEALDGGQVELQAQVMGRLAEALTFSETRERRVALCEEAERLARRLGDPRTLASVLAHEHWALWSPDNLERRLEISHEIVSAARQGHDPVLEVEGRLWCVTDLMESSQVRVAEREFSQWLALAEQSPQQYQVWSVEVMKAAQGSCAPGSKKPKVWLWPRLRSASVIATRTRFSCSVCRSPACAGRALPRARGASEGVRRAVCGDPDLAMRAELSLRRVRSPSRRSARTRPSGRGGLFPLPQGHFWLPNLTLAGDSAALLGDVERSRALYELLVPYERRCVIAGPIAACWGPTSRTLGSLAATLGQWEEAERHFEDGIAHNFALGARVWLTRTRLEYAEMLAARHRLPGFSGGDGQLRAHYQHAHELLSRVLKTARELSLVDPERKALELLSQLQPGSPQDRGQEERMSEADVRLRISAGLARLSLSGGTVLERQARSLLQAPSSDPRVRVAGALAAGLLLGRLVNHVGR